jgi:hypothetical protein
MRPLLNDTKVVISSSWPRTECGIDSSREPPPLSSPGLTGGSSGFHDDAPCLDSGSGLPQTRIKYGTGFDTGSGMTEKGVIQRSPNIQKPEDYICDGG